MSPGAMRQAQDLRAKLGASLGKAGPPMDIPDALKVVSREVLAPKSESAKKEPASRVAASKSDHPPRNAAVVSPTDAAGQIQYP